MRMTATLRLQHQTEEPPMSRKVLFVRNLLAKRMTLSWFQRYGWKANLSWFSKICNHFREIAAWIRKSLTMITVLLEKRPLKGKFSKTYSERIHHVTEWRFVCKFRENWLTGNRQSRALFTWQKKTKLPQGLPLSLLRGSRPKSVRASSEQYTRSSPNFIQIRSLPAEL